MIPGVTCKGHALRWEGFIIEISMCYFSSSVWGLNTCSCSTGSGMLRSPA